MSAHTVVHTEESFEGWLVRLLRPILQRNLDKALRGGLEALKARTESR